MPRKTEAHPALNERVTELLRIAHQNPFWQFEDGDLVSMMNLTKYTVDMMKRAKDSPFVNGTSRPERVQGFLDSHPGWVPAAEKTNL